MEQQNLLKVTPIEEILKKSKGELVELPGFYGNDTLVVRLKRPSMLMMAKTGKIPNSLLSQAGKLFTNGLNSVSKNDDIEMLSELFNILEIICKESLAEPTYDEFKENDIQLTDQQMLAIFNYTQRGVKALENFRS